jgi:hypothetical protein
VHLRVFFFYSSHLHILIFFFSQIHIPSLLFSNSIPLNYYVDSASITNKTTLTSSFLASKFGPTRPLSPLYDIKHFNPKSFTKKHFTYIIYHNCGKKILPVDPSKSCSLAALSTAHFKLFYASYLSESW